MRWILLGMFFIAVLAPSSLGQWEKLTFPRGSIYTLLNTPEGLLASSGRYIYLSKDNGSTWDSLSSVSIDPTEFIEVGDLLLSASSYGRTPEAKWPLPCVFRSVDSGRSWDSVLAGVYGAPSIVLVGSTLYTNPDGELFSSVDTGRTWSRIDSSGEFPGHIAAIITNGSTIYLGIQTDRLIQPDRLYRSTDDGNTWDSLDTGIPWWYFNVLAESSRVYVAAQHGGFYVSSDQGNTWKTMNLGLPDSSGFRNLFLVENHLLLASVFRDWSQTVYQLDLSGTRWEKFDAGLSLDPYAYICDFSSNDSYVFLAAWNSIWRRLLSDLVTQVKGPSAYLPKAFIVEQNYPNPFNPSTTIKYELPKASEVKLSIYDMLGREVSVLVNERRNAGVHEVKFDGAGLSSGVYFYRLQAGNSVQAKKLVILK